ncbi:MAG: VPLPA-CTERM sorting domain-containing protein [Kiloniellales bacterium]
MKYLSKLHIVHFLIGVFCFATFANDANAKVITLSFYMKGVTENRIGASGCESPANPRDCIVNFADDEIYGYFIFNDKNNDGIITLFEWMEYSVTGSWNFGRGFLPVDFDPIEDDYNSRPDRLDRLDFQYQEVLDEFGNSTGKITGFGQIGRGSELSANFFLSEDQTLTYSAGDGGLNISRFSGFPPGGDEFAFFYPSYTWNTLRHGVDVVSPPPVPLPAAAWFFLTALGGLFGLRYYRRREA